MAPLELHEKIFVDSDFLETTHGEIGCTTCHGGDNTVADWRLAHRGVHRDPSMSNVEAACGECHEDIVKDGPKSLHYTLQPFLDKVKARSNPTDHTIIGKVMEGYNTHCTQCHASCGQCHISRPDSLGSGFLEGHLFQKRPPQTTTCTACHGSRLHKEYEGKNEGIPADVHKKKFMKCTKCHTGAEMHAAGPAGGNRYDQEPSSKCLDCHAEILTAEDEIEMHQMHGKDFQCQVCHSMPYKNCAGCHVGKDSEGLPYFQVDKSWMDFKIGKNINITEKRPQKLVVVRHVPVTPSLFDYYVKNGLPNFDALPTWKMATPHNIQRTTPQSESCNSCHGHPELFLLPKDISEDERKANEKVVLTEEEVPPPQ